MKGKSVLAWVLVLTLAGGGCAGAMPKQSKGVQAGFVAGRWILDHEEFERGEAEGLVIGEGALQLASERQQGTLVSRAYDTGGLFDTLTLEAIRRGPEAFPLTIHVRTSLEGETWSPWTALNLDESDDSKDEAEADYGQITPVTAGRYLQVRLILWGDAGQTPVVHRLVIAYMYAAAGPGLYQARAAALPTQPEAGAPRPAIIPRAGWGADERMMTWKPAYRHPVRVVIHHTVTPNHEDNPAATVRAIYYFHAITRQWGDIGYNYLIDWQGNIYEGRAGGEKVIGGHARGYNEGSVGIALMGTYTQQDITPAMRSSLIALLAWIASRYGIDPQGHHLAYERSLPNIMGHRVVANTNCPGDMVEAQLEDIRGQVAALVNRYGGLAAVTATPRPRLTPSPTLTPTVEIGSTPTPSPEMSEPATFTVTLPATPLPTPQATATPPRPTAKIIITGMEIHPYPPLAGQPITLTVHLSNPGPEELRQVGIQVLFDADTVADGQIGLAWQLERLRAGQVVTLLSSERAGPVMSAGVHRLSVRAVGRDTGGHVLAGEWGPWTISVQAPDTGTALTGWRSVIARWGTGLHQIWQAFLQWVNHVTASRGDTSVITTQPVIARRPAQRADEASPRPGGWITGCWLSVGGKQ